MKELFNKYRDIIMYLIFGVLTTVISLIVFYVLTKTILNANDKIELQIANIISWIAGVTFAYITNSKYVFNGKRTFNEVIKFVSSRLSTLFLDMFIMYLFVFFLKYNPDIMKLISQVLVIVSNYILSKLFVFKNSK